MPYECKKRGKKYVVVKKGTEDPVYGTHTNEEQAKKQIYAIESREHGTDKK